MACAWLVAAIGPRGAARRCRRVDASALGRGRADGRHRLLRAGRRRAWAACSTPSRRSAALRLGHDLRGPGGDRARGGRRPRRSAAPTSSRSTATAGSTRARRSSTSSRDLDAGDRRGGRRRRASIAASPPPPRRPAPPRPRRAEPTVSCSAAASSRTGCCSRTRPRACAGSACACSSRRSAAPTTAGSPTARRRSRQLAHALERQRVLQLPGRRDAAAVLRAGRAVDVLAPVRCFVLPFFTRSRPLAVTCIRVANRPVGPTTPQLRCQTCLPSPHAVRSPSVLEVAAVGNGQSPPLCATDTGPSGTSGPTTSTNAPWRERSSAARSATGRSRRPVPCTCPGARTPGTASAGCP